MPLSPRPYPRPHPRCAHDVDAAQGHERPPHPARPIAGTPPPRVLLLALGERPVVFLDELAELLRHFVAAAHERAIGLVADLAPQAVLEPLQALGDLLLQFQQLPGVAIVAPVLEL